MFVLILPLVSSDMNSELSTVKVGQCIQLVETCANCSSINLTSVRLPNNTILYYITPMSQNSTTYNYTFCKTTLVGDYSYDVIGDPDGIYTVASVKFTVSKTGDIIQTSNSLIYIFALVFGLSLFCFFLYGSIMIPFANERNEEGSLVSINWMKYLKIFFMCMTYVTFIWANYMVYNIVLGYTAFEGTAQFFYVIHRIAFTMLIPLIAISAIFTLIRYVKDIDYNKALKYGQEIQ